MTEGFPTPPPPDEDGIREIPSLAESKPDPTASQDHTTLQKVEKLFAPRDKNDKPLRQKPPTPSMPRPGVIKKRLEELYVGAGMVLTPVDPKCAMAVMEAAPQCAESMEQLCRENEAVRRIVLRIIQTSTIGAVITAHAPIIMAVAMHHMPMFQSMDGKNVAEDAEEYLKQQGDEAA